MKKCTHCGQTFAAPRGLSVHTCKVHGDCADRDEDRHRGGQLYVRLGPDMLDAVRNEAEKRGVSGAEVARIALRRLVKR